jgi:hypothetical protein
MGHGAGDRDVVEGAALGPEVVKKGCIETLERSQVVKISGRKSEALQVIEHVHEPSKHEVGTRRLRLRLKTGAIAAPATHRLSRRCSDRQKQHARRTHKHGEEERLAHRNLLLWCAMQRPLGYCHGP